jgi:hypothetical protein
VATPDIILDNARILLPGVADAVINLELFNTIDELAREALNLTPPANVDAANTTWLSEPNYIKNYQALLHGTLARLFSHQGKPYSSPDSAKAHFAQYLTYLGLARAEESATTAPTTTRTRILAQVRAELPLARDAAINLELFNVTDQIRQEVLQLTVSTSASPDDWLTTTQYGVYYQAIIHGILQRLYSQVGKPWSSTDLAKTHEAQYAKYIDISRADTTTALTTARARIQMAIRVQLPDVHDAAINFELFNTVDKIRQEALRLTPTISTSPDAWLTTAQWADCYQAIYYGTLARLYAQVGKPWSSPKLWESNFALYEREMDNVRTRDASAAPTSATVRLINTALLNLPAAVETTVRAEYFNALAEFLKTSSVWQEDIVFSTVVGRTDYDLVPDGAGLIHRLIFIKNENDIPVPATMAEPGVMVLATEPSVVETLTATVVLVVTDPLESTGYPTVPDWILPRYGDGLLSGILSKAMLHPSKPYTNQQLAIFHGRKFRAAISTARSESRHKNLYDGQTWRFPRFASGRQR